MVVDDNRNILASVRILLSNVFNNVVTLASPANMLSAIRENRINVVLLDMNFASGINNGNEGFFWLQEINRHFPEVPVVLFTAYADIQLAVRAIKQGAFDFVEKPWDNRKLTDVLINAYKSQNRKDATPKAAEESMFLGHDAGNVSLARNGGKSGIDGCQCIDHRRKRHGQRFACTRIA